MGNVILTGSSGLLGRRLKKISDNTFFDVSMAEGFDITDAGSLSRISDNGYDCLIHAAAAFGNDEDENYRLNLEVNAVGTFNVCQLAKAKGIKHLINISSLSAVDDASNEYFNSYGLSKRVGEDIVKHYCGMHGIKCLILRFSQLYDELGEARVHQPLLYHLIDSIYSNKEITIFGKTDPYRNFLFIDDAVQIINNCIEQETGGLFNCINPDSFKISELIDLVGRVTSNDAKVKIEEEREGAKSIFIPEDNLIGGIDFTSLEKGIESYLRNKYE